MRWQAARRIVPIFVLVAVVSCDSADRYELPPIQFRGNWRLAEGIDPSVYRVTCVVLIPARDSAEEEICETHETFPQLYVQASCQPTDSSGAYLVSRHALLLEDGSAKTHARWRAAAYASADPSRRGGVGTNWYFGVSEVVTSSSTAPCGFLGECDGLERCYQGNFSGPRANIVIQHRGSPCRR
jgi:hypothetical protein